MGPTKSSQQPAALDELLEEGRGEGGAAAEALRRAARVLRESGDPLGALDLFLQASERAKAGPTEPKLHSEIELELGSLYEAELGRLDQAMERYQRAFKLDRSSTRAIDAGRRIYRALGDFRQVVRLYEVELEVGVADERRVEVLVALGRLLAERLGDPAAAASHLEDALSLSPADPGAMELLAALYISPDFPAAPDDQAAQSRLDRAATLFVALADARHAAGDRDHEVAFLRRALGADPYLVDAAMRLESAYADGGRIEELRRLYRQGAPVPNRALKQAGLALDAGDLPEALEAALTAYAEGDDAAECITRIEALLEQKKDLAQLASFRERLIELSPVDGAERAQHLVALAALQQKVGPAGSGVARAEASLRDALAFDPTHEEAFRRLAELLAMRRDYAGLIEVAEDAIAAAPLEDQPRRLADLAEIYEKKIGDVAAAADAWLRAEAILTTPRGTLELKRLSQKQERWTSLTASLERELQAADAPAARAEALKRLAQVHRERHDLEQATELLEQALELRADDGALYRALADLHEHEGRIDQVARTIRRQLKVAKEKVERLNLLRRLALLYDERLADLDGVVWACEQILEQLPGDRDALRRLESAYERAGEAGEESLVAILEKHAQAAATPAERLPVLYRLANLLEKRGDLAGAVDRLERMLKADKNDARAQEMLARLYEQLGRWADAALLLERSLARAGAGPEGADAWKRYARLVDGKLGDAMRAPRAWREVLERRPTDREALEAQAKLARTRGDAKLLDEVLERRQLHAGPDEATALGLERATLAEEKLRDPARAITLLRHILDELSPRDVEAHARLRRLEKLQGHVDASLRVAERELFLQPDPTLKLELAVEIARAWSEEADDPKRAISAWRRVTAMDPANWDALTALATLYGQVGDWLRVIEIDERRLELATEWQDSAEQRALLLGLAGASERELADPRRAFEYLRRAHALDPDGGALAELSRVAEAHGLWEELCAVYAAQPGLEARLEVAAIAAERMNDPKRAFAVLRGALELDPDGTRLVPELERLSLRAEDPESLLAVYQQLAAQRSEVGGRIELLRRRARVREERMSDPSGALDELVAAFRLDPDDELLLAEIRRLAEATSRWEDVLAIEGFRFHRAPDEAKLAIALEAAALVESKVRDSLRAFRAYLRALQLAPDDPQIHEHLWRLARQIGVIETAPAAARARTSPPRTRRREPTLEIQLDDLIIDEPKERRDSTLELTLDDLVPQKWDTSSTIDLSLSDVHGIARPPRMPAPGRSAPPPMPTAAPLAERHSAWEELALVLFNLHAPDEETRFRRLLAVSDMWERGAGDLDRAFATLSATFLLDPGQAEARQALERLADRTGAWDKLVAVLDQAIEATGSAEQAVELLLDSAQVRERQGQADQVEERLHRVLGMRPDCEPALVKLETTYRETERLGELVILLERRMGGLVERLPQGETRHQRAVELAQVYERLGNTYEAISAWKRVADETPDHAPAFSALARLYQSVGQWSKVIEALTRELDVVDVSPSGHLRARELKRRIGEIFEKELELPERAIEAFEALEEADAVDEAGDDALERLYQKLGRFAKLAALYGRRAERAQDPEARGQLLERRGQLLSDKLADFGAAAEVLRQLRQLHPDDDALVGRLAEALGRAGKPEEQLELLRERAAGKRGVKKPERVRRLVELARLEAQIGDIAAAQRTLEKAIELEPGDPSVLAELAQVREGGSDWDGYAAARERESEVASSVEHAVRALVDAARVHDQKRGDAQAARRDLERALEKDPQFVPALQALGALHRRQGADEAADELAERELAQDAERAPTPERHAELAAALGQSNARRGDLDAAARWYRESLAAMPGFSAAVNGLCDVAARGEQWQELETLAREALAQGQAQGTLAVSERVPLLHRVAEAAERQGRDDEAYSALVEADRLVPGDLRTRMRLGENRYRATRFREAAQHLGALAEHVDDPRLTEVAPQAGEALYHAALAELKLRRPERVVPLLEAAVRIFPVHATALGMLAERALEAGDLERAVGFLERQAGALTDPLDRALKQERLGDVILSELKDPQRACAAFQAALAAARSGASDALYEKTLGLEREIGQLERASVTLGRLLEREAPIEVRARRLREAASLDAALGRGERAKERLREALELQPLDHEALAGLSAMLVTEGADQEAAALLTRALAHLPPPAPELPDLQSRATLWMRLGECRERLRDGRGAAAAFEKALEADPTRRPLREALVARYGDDPAHDPITRVHHAVLLADDPLHANSLRALGRIERRAGARDQGRRFLELLAVAGALSDEERSSLSSSAPGERGDDEPVGSLDEDDHTRLAHPDARALAPVFATLWEGAAATNDRLPDLASHGVGPDQRVSPVADSDLARAYSLCARALGNRKTGLYLKPDPEHQGIALVARIPPAMVVGPSLTLGRSLADVRFLLGRALEITRPEYVLAAALDRDAFTRFLSAILRAFHPRHARRRLDKSDERDDEAAMWKRALPYKVAKRLAALFSSLPDTQFSTASWRRAVQHTGNRAGLVASGDIVAAARVLTAEGDEEAIRELARFAVSDDYVALRTKLTG